MDAPHTVSTAIIGAGFSGTLLALHLLRESPQARVVLIERNARFGLGQAYGTPNPDHLLNVPAGRMSAFHDRPNDFVDWLNTHSGGRCEGHDFVPRATFGEYIRHLLTEEIRQGTPNRDRLALLRADITALRTDAGGVDLTLENGERLRTARAVLAIGNFPPEPPPMPDPAFFDTPFYIPDPWQPGWVNRVAPTDPVLLIGTGLTMVDALISLLGAGHAGPVYALSRRGLLPRRHQAGPGHAQATTAYPTGLLALTQTLRQAARAAAAAGETWQSVIDQLRPFTQDLWQTMSLEDRRRFLRHLRPWWDVHRHRMAPAVADRVDAALASGQLRKLTGRLRGYMPISDRRVAILYQPRGGAAARTLEVALALNCSGPSCDYDRIRDPLVRQLLDDAIIRPDPLRLGLDVTSNCAVRGADGAISRRLFAVGPVTKAAFWEMTAVPDLRRQCEFLARHLTAQMPPAPAPR